MCSDSSSSSYGSIDRVSPTPTESSDVRSRRSFLAGYFWQGSFIAKAAEFFSNTSTSSLKDTSDSDSLVKDDQCES